MGLGYGMIETALALAVVLAPLLAGILYAHNPEWIYAVSLPGIALALLLTKIFLPRIKEDKYGTDMEMGH
jgi:MFS family permease